MTWTTLTMQVTTPLFNGGADAGTDDGTGVRPASIRGAMRFWFRALAGALTGSNLRLLGALEHRVFGGIGNEGADGASASPLLLRVSRQPAAVLPAGPHSFLPSPTLPLNQRRRHDGRWILYLMGQGLADLGNVEIRRPYVAAGQEFELKVGFRHLRHEDAESRAAIEALAMASLWLACTYGGIGARTRRGLGGVRITDTSGTELPEPWDKAGALLTPALGYYTSLRMIWPDAPPISSCMRYLSTLARGARLNPRAWGDGVPAFPVLSRTYAPAGTSGGKPFPNWENALIQAGEELRHFRAAQPNERPGASYRPLIETPEWITTVHGQDSRYPVGALGLPVVMKDNYIANADGENTAEPARRASPLWIRAVGAGREWRLLSFAFQAKFLHGGAHLWHDSRLGKELQVTDNDVKRQTDQWIKVLHEDKTFIPYEHDDGTVAPDDHRSTGELRR
jgi:CRISPR type III-B/RAMP module RAMP protein Cmr1